MDPKELRGLMEAYSEVYAPQEVDEAVKGESSERRKDLAAERRAGIKPLSAKEGERYASHKMSQMAYAKRKRMGEEVEQIDEISQKLATSAYAQRRTGEFEGDDSSDRVAKTNKLKGRIEKKFGAKAGEHADRAADVKTFGRKDASGRRKQSPQPRIQTSDHENQREFKRELRIRRDRRLRAARGEDTNEQFDIFDVVLEFLCVEGYAETLEEAEWLMSNVIDEEAIDIILGEAEKPFPYEKVKAKQVALRDKGSAGLDRRMQMGMAVRRAKEAEKTGGSQRDAGKGWYHAKEDYVNEAQAARENPEKYEREQSKKYAPVRGERTPMPPRGDKRREDFEKWYAANVR